MSAARRPRAASRRGRHILPLRVYYEDTDAGGIVYYANYLRFAERGRTELLRLIGLEHKAIEAETRHLLRGAPLHDRLSEPARLDDTIEVVTVSAMRGASLDMVQEARRGDEMLRRAAADRLHERRGRPNADTGRARAALDAVAARGVAPLTPYSDPQLKDGELQIHAFRRSPAPPWAAGRLHRHVGLRPLPPGRLGRQGGHVGAAARRRSGLGHHLREDDPPALAANRRAESFEDTFWSGGSLEDL